MIKYWFYLFPLAIHTSFADDLDSHCKYYASKAVRQHHLAQQAKCEFKGSRWSDNEEGQYDWCLTVQSQVSNAENKTRRKLLLSCLKGKSSRLDPDNQISLPANCYDPEQNYIPIRYIISKGGYNSEATLSQTIDVRGGFIKYDFNEDKKPDYIFIEKNKAAEIQLTTCLSDSNILKYFRKPTTFLIYENPDPSFMARSQFISFKKGLLQLSDSYHEHNWGGDSATASYIFDTKANDFSLIFVRSDYYSGDGMRGAGTFEYDFENKLYKETLDCSGVYEDMRETCKSYKSSGKIILKGTPPSLFKKPISYSGLLDLDVQLIPDEKNASAKNKKI